MGVTNGSERVAGERRDRRTLRPAALGVGALTVLAAPGVASGATFEVQNTNDTGAGSLRDAIGQANAAGGADKITFNSSVTGTIGLSSGQIAITDPLEIEGPGAAELALDGENLNRILFADPGPGNEVSISDLELTRGIVYSGGAGGAIHLASGVLSLERTLFDSNGFTAGYFNTTRGGAIYSDSATQLYVSDSSFVNNRLNIDYTVASYVGGAIYSRSNVVEVADSTFIGNDAVVAGAIFASGGGETTIERSEFNFNTAYKGTSTISAGDATIVNSYIHDAVGGILPGDTGAAISGYGLEIVNTTVSDNSSTGGTGGAIGSGTIHNSVFSGNTGNYAGPPYIDSIYGAWTVSYSNLDVQSAGTYTDGGGNGGAIVDGGDPADFEPVDFRGAPRPSGAAPDMGHIESTPDLEIVTNLSDGPSGSAPAGSLRAAVDNAIADSDETTIAFDPTISGTIELTDGELELFEDTIISNRLNPITVDAGGASRVFNLFGDTTSIEGLGITGGQSAGGGAGIRAGADLNLTKSAVYGNTATGAYATGGGIEADSGVTVEVTNSTIDSNSAARGGGIGSTSAAAVTLESSTISGNTATVAGGGGSLDGNSATVHNTIFADNSAPTGPDAYSADAFDTFESQYSLFESVAGGVVPNYGGSITGVDPGLGPFQRNGGLTGNRAITYASAAAGFGDGGDYQPTDQRGVTRPQPVGGDPDIGAYEADADAPTLTVTSVPGAPDGFQDFLLEGDDGDGSGVALYECNLDGGAWQACDQAVRAGPQDGGVHVFYARAIDGAGNSSGEYATAANLSTDDIIVDSAEDSLTLDFLDGQTTLREALEAANQLADETGGAGAFYGDMISFSPSLNGSTITLDGAQLEVNSDTYITGPGADQLTIDGNGDSRVLSVAPASQTGASDAVRLSGFEITGGDGSGVSGGGIHVDQAELILDGLNVNANFADQAGGGIAVIGDSSGPTESKLTVIDSTISGNGATIGGGGLFVSDVAASDAGSFVYIGRTTISDNYSAGSAGLGGGIRATNDTHLSLVNSTVSGNSVDPAASTGPSGGGIFLGGGAGSSLTTDSATIADNTVDGGGNTGGGIGIASGSQLYLTNTLVADNIANGGEYEIAKTGAFNADHSLIESTYSGTPTGSNNVLGSDPELGPLQDNGGLTETHGLGENSPAIDAGATGRGSDQRGEARPDGAADDIGAVEQADIFAPSVTIDSPADGYVTSDTTPTMMFSSPDEDVDYYQVRFNPVGPGGFANAYSGTATPLPLNPGEHTFDVRAVDEAGNKGELAEISFTVDTTPPYATIDSPVDGTLTNDPTPTITFSAPDPDVDHFEVQIEGGGFTTQTSPYTPASPLAEGENTIEVRAVDGAAPTPNTGAPDQITIEVDTTGPMMQIDSPANGATITDDSSPTITFSSPDPDLASTECSIDGGPFGPCISPNQIGPFADGDHVFAVRGTDVAGNTGDPVEISFEIETTTDPPTPPDTEVTGVQVKVPKKIKAKKAKKGKLGKVKAGAAEIVNATVKGKVTAKGKGKKKRESVAPAAKAFKIKPARGQSAAGQIAKYKLVLKKGKKDGKKLFKLSKKKKLTANLVVKLVDAAGNADKRKFTVKVK